MPKASDLGPESRFVALFVGESGSGKTVAECSFPGPIEVHDFDGRIRGILGANWITPEKKKEITYYSYPPRKLGIVKEINDRLEAMQVASTVNQLTTNTLIMDSLTSETFAMVQQSIPLTHEGKKGKSIGPIAMPGPEDYGFEAATTYSILSFFRSIPVPNVIVSAHVVDKWGKADSDNPYSDSVIIGEQLSVRPKIAENIKIYFDHVFRFSKRMVNNEERFFVRFRGGLERTSYAELPLGDYDITGKNFYEFMMSYIKK